MWTQKPECGGQQTSGFHRHKEVIVRHKLLPLQTMKPPSGAPPTLHLYPSAVFNKDTLHELSEGCGFTRPLDLPFSGRSWQFGRRRLPKPWGWPMPEGLPWRGPGSDRSSSSGTPCCIVGRRTAGPLRWTGGSSTSTSAWRAGGGSTSSLRRCQTPRRGGPGPQRPAPQAQAHLRGERRESADPPEGEQKPEGYVALGTGAGAPGGPCAKGKAASMRRNLSIVLASLGS